MNMSFYVHPRLRYSSDNFWLSKPFGLDIPYLFEYNTHLYITHTLNF